jgi:hypothetical protein
VIGQERPIADTDRGPDQRGHRARQRGAGDDTGKVLMGRLARAVLGAARRPRPRPPAAPRE